MASEVDISNLALAHLGDDATVASLDPPEGSAQAEHCQRFYPIARDTLLEMHNWKFASKRITLAQLTSASSVWEYAYAVPSDMIKLVAILDPEAADDYASFPSADVFDPIRNNTGYGAYTPQPFSAEVLETGTQVIYTNQEDAVLRYVARITDTTKFSPLFVNTLSWHLASMLAGPMIKGDVGAAEAKRCMQMVAQFLAWARSSDSDQRNIHVQHVVPWMAGR